MPTIRASFRSAESRAAANAAQFRFPAHHLRERPGGNTSFVVVLDPRVHDAEGFGKHAVNGFRHHEVTREPGSFR